MLRTANDYDRWLLQQEMDRLKALGFSFKGDTEAERLGIDAWVLGVAVVEEKQKASRPSWRRRAGLT